MSFLHIINYGIAITDGFCTARDEINIRFFEEEYDGNILTLPNDSTVCEQLLPIIIEPQSDFTNEFTLNGNSASTFEINQAGNFQIATQIENCTFSENFNLTIAPCEVDIYLPTSFSPNNDGINDFYEPLGNEFEGQQLQVFDRWGSLIFQTNDPPFAWDGSDLDLGLYVVTFSYLNLKNLQSEVVSADVMVVR